MGRSDVAPALLAVMLSSLLLGCSLLAPLPKRTSLEERLAAFPARDAPVEEEVVIYWDDYQIPFVEAKTDTDLAVGLGLVHAHLRLGQMELLRRVSHGRIAEMVGPLATDIDHSLRILGFGRAAANIEAMLPEETRAWLESFVRGINHYQANVGDLPYEFSALNLAREPWTVADVLTIGRLAATDVNWLVWFQLLKLRERSDWSELWPRLLDAGGAPGPDTDGGGSSARLGGLLAGVGRLGSNSFVVSGGKSETGAALIASDPHLSITIPNLWLIAGYRSPSHHAAGLMVPGLPFIAIGRNPRIAWGGANLRAASSDLYDVSAVDAAEVEERKETMAVRWWFDRTATVRETEWGPVISEAPALDFWKGPPLALRWTGHEASDEITAMLCASRARSWQEFRAAFRTFAVSGQTMLYADADGNIGRVPAVRLPVRDGSRPRDLVLDPSARETRWNGYLDSTDLPALLNPAQGFLVSANNRLSDVRATVGYFYPPDDRAARIAGLLERREKIGVGDLQAIQRDVYMASAVKLRDLLIDKIASLGLDEDLDGGQRDLVERLKAWDGHYREESEGALAFELTLHYVTRNLFERGLDEAQAMVFAGIGRLGSRIAEAVRTTRAEVLAPALRDAIRRAARRFRDFAVWGGMHRLRLAHPLNLLPLIGARFRFGDYPIGGSSQTVMKTVHGSTDESHPTRYGSNARHVSDLSDMDRNYFVLLGGQDGWFRSSTFLDQVPLWLAGEYIQVPLRLSTVRATFPHKTVLSPKKEPG